MHRPSLKKLYVEEINPRQTQVFVSGDEYVRLGIVLRAKVGEELIVLDGKGNRFLGHISGISKEGLVVELRSQLEIPIEPGPIIHLVQAILKPPAMDYVIEKSSEIGIESVYPFKANRSVSQITMDQRPRKLEHWRKISIRSFLQCERARPLVIANIFDNIWELLDNLGEPREPRIVFWEGERFRGLKACLQEMERPKRIVFAVGPEGGFERSEIEAFYSSGFVPVSLGNRLLKAETVCVAVGSILQYLYGDMG